VSRLMRYSRQFSFKYVYRLMRYSTQFCVKYMSRLMRYSAQFCVKYMSRLMMYSTQFCVKYMSSLMMYSTQFSVMTCCNAMQLCFVVRNITVFFCEKYVSVVTCFNILHSPLTASPLTRNNCVLRTSHIATFTRYSIRNKLLLVGMC
jgi:hypothetical protein